MVYFKQLEIHCWFLFSSISNLYNSKAHKEIWANQTAVVDSFGQFVKVVKLQEAKGCNQTMGQLVYYNIYNCLFFE